MNKEDTMFWRCVNQMKDYCTGEPDWETKPHQRFEENPNPDQKGHWEGGTCKRDAAKCKQRQTFLEMYPPKEKS